jgi:hypothetical protein
LLLFLLCTSFFTDSTHTKNRKTTHVEKTLELGTPVAGLISLCIVCTIASSQPTCVSTMFITRKSNVGPPIDQTTVGVVSSITSEGEWPAISGWFPNHNVASDENAYQKFFYDDDDDDDSVPIAKVISEMDTNNITTTPTNATTTTEKMIHRNQYQYSTGPIISAIVSPIACVFAVATVAVSFANKRVIDIGVVFMLLSFGVNAWASYKQSLNKNSATKGQQYTAITFSNDDDNDTPIDSLIVAFEGGLIIASAIGLALHRVFNVSQKKQRNSTTNS